ncbi:MAG: hypothetical protein KAT58_10910 [candidate division Zixibacteria bacterium]|nr:hypothetical protein [candidate division Zixibacteria bacterium]
MNGALLIMKLMRWLSDFLTAPWLPGVGTVVLAATLCILVWYARSTHKIMKLQNEEVGLRKRPVVSFMCSNSKHINFPTTLLNFSFVHAKARVEATVICDRENISHPRDSPYAGEQIWNLQAGSNTGFVTTGHMSLLQLLKKHGIDIRGPEVAAHEITVTVEMWVINAKDDEENLQQTRCKNPVLQWYWQDEAWVFEVSPHHYDWFNGRLPLPQ